MNGYITNIKKRYAEKEGSGKYYIQEKHTNKSRRAVISADRSPTTVRVIRTDEEVMIARAVCRLLGFSSPSNVNSR
jgi:acetate kinase